MTTRDGNRFATNAQFSLCQGNSSNSLRNYAVCIQIKFSVLSVYYQLQCPIPSKIVITILCLNKIYFNNIFRSMKTKAFTIKICEEPSQDTLKSFLIIKFKQRYVRSTRSRVKITCKESGLMPNCVVSRLFQWFSATSLATEFQKPFAKNHPQDTSKSFLITKFKQIHVRSTRLRVKITCKVASQL